MKFKPEEVTFHVEEYQAILAKQRSKDYPPLRYSPRGRA